MSNMRIAKYETLIEDIDSRIRSLNPINPRGNNIALALIYDYEKCNEYAKVIMDKSTLLFTWYLDNDLLTWYLDNDRSYPTYDEFKDPKKRIEASKKLVQMCRGDRNDADDVDDGERYKFIFWALMILTVEKTDAEEHLALICDFAKRFGITEDEFEDIIQVIKIVYNEGPVDYVFKSYDVQGTFIYLMNMSGRLNHLLNMFDEQAIESINKLLSNKPEDGNGR